MEYCGEKEEQDENNSGRHRRKVFPQVVPASVRLQNGHGNLTEILPENVLEMYTKKCSDNRLLEQVVKSLWARKLEATIP